MDTEVATSLGQQIRQSRLRRGLTQSELARAVGVTAVTIYNWEHGRTVPRSLAHILRLAEALNLEVIFREEDGPGKKFLREEGAYGDQRRDVSEAGSTD